MAATVFIGRESVDGEPRVAGSPETVKKMKALGLDVVVETGAGELSRIPDAEFEKVGARIGASADAGSADVVLKVRRPTSAEIAACKPGAVVIAAMDPYGQDAAIAKMAKATGIFTKFQKLTKTLLRTPPDRRYLD